MVKVRAEIRTDATSQSVWRGVFDPISCLIQGSECGHARAHLPSPTSAERRGCSARDRDGGAVDGGEIVDGVMRVAPRPRDPRVSSRLVSDAHRATVSTGKVPGRAIACRRRRGPLDNRSKGYSLPSSHRQFTRRAWPATPGGACLIFRRRVGKFLVAAACVQPRAGRSRVRPS